jgi:hypothetical protein
LSPRLKKQNCSVGKPISFCLLGPVWASPIGGCLIVQIVHFIVKSGLSPSAATCQPAPLPFRDTDA